MKIMEKLDIYNRRVTYMQMYYGRLKKRNGDKGRMNVFDMTKEDFKKVPERGGWSRDIEEFSSLVIIPLNYAHDSGWMCMNFVAVNKDGEPICRLSGCSDVLNLDGIGGYGYRDRRLGELSNHIEPKGWSIDCLPCGYLRLFSRSTMTAGAALSSFEIYAK